MTFLEKAMEIDRARGNTGRDENYYYNFMCPSEYHFEEQKRCRTENTPMQKCIECWNREMPDTNKSVLLTMDKDKELNIDKKIKEQEECSYNKGLEVAWELAKKIWSGKDSENVEIFGTKFVYEIYQLSPQEAIAKLKEYEEAQIEVGDVVRLLRTMQVSVVTRIQDKYVRVLYKDGTGGMIDVPIDKIEKTGKHIDLSQIFEQIGE